MTYAELQALVALATISPDKVEKAELVAALQAAQAEIDYLRAIGRAYQECAIERWAGAIGKKAER